jgi:autotransporter-associated beta strand protein
MSLMNRLRNLVYTTRRGNRRPVPSRWRRSRVGIEILEGRICPATDLVEPRGSMAPLVQAYGQLPLSFEPNQGQADPQADFGAHGDGYALALAPDRAVLGLLKPSASGTGDVLLMQLVGANTTAPGTGQDPVAGTSNYLVGSDPGQWHTDIPNYSQVTYQGVYPGIDLTYYGNQRQLEYDFTVAPGADPGAILLRFQGDQSVTLDEQGDLVLHTGGGDVVEHAPVLYQEVGGVRQTVSGGYVLEGDGQVGFQVGVHDSSRALVIDPVLSYATYLGGSGEDIARAIAVDSSGNAYIAGYSFGSFPTTTGAFQTSFGGNVDAFVVKLNASGTGLVYATYLGGNGDDEALGIAVNSAGNAYVTGLTSSANFPTTAGVPQGSAQGGYDAFLTELNSTGSSLVYSTHLGGSGNDYGQAIAVDSSGNAYVTGYTSSTNFPTTGGVFQANHAADGGNNDAFACQIAAAGTSLGYCTYLGGGGNDQGTGIAIDGSGNAFVTGSTTSGNFPTTTGASSTSFGGGTDAFVTKINPSATTLTYSTYLGGSDTDFAQGIAVDSSGSAYVAGVTSSLNFPVTAGAFQTANADRNLFKTTNGAGAWSAANAGLADNTVNALVIDPTNHLTLYAGTTSHGVSKSTDGGSTWNGTGLAGVDITAIAVDPVSPSTIYASVPTGIYMSSNGGSSWTLLNTSIITSLGGITIDALAIDPNNHQTVYAGAGGGNFSGVIKSTNGGGTWNFTGGIGADVHGLVVDPTTNPATIYAGTHDGVYRTTNGGNSWSFTGPASFNAITPLAIDPSHPATLYFANNNGIFKTTNSGGTWGSPLLQPGAVYALAVDPTSSSTIYAGTTAGVYKSTDGGTTWAQNNTGLGSTTPVFALAIDATSSSTVYAASSGGSDAFVTKLNAAGSGLVYSTYLGGSASDFGFGIAVDGSGGADIVGYTSSADFPIVSGAPQATSGGFTDAFMARLDPAGSGLTSSTYLGGNNNDYGYGIAVDGSGNAYFTGYAFSGNLPTTSGSYQPSFGGVTDAFVAKVPLSVSGPLTYTAPSDGQAHHYRLRLHGSTLELVNDDTASVVASGALASTTSVTVTGANNLDDQLTVDFAFGGFFTLPGGISFDGGTGGHDSLAVRGNGSTSATYSPDAATTGKGIVSVSSGALAASISFVHLGPVDLFSMATATLQTPLTAANDILTMANGFNLTSSAGAVGTIPALVVSGSTGGTTIAQAAFWSNSVVALDTTATDGNDTITITSANNAHNNSSLVINTAAGADEVDINGAVSLAGNFNITTQQINSNATTTLGGNASWNAGGGSISDGNGTSLNLSAVVLNATAAGGLTLDTQVTSLASDSHAGNGTQTIRQTGTATITHLDAGGGIINLNSGTFRIPAAAGGDALADASTVSVTSPAVLDLNGQNESVDILNGNGTLTNGAAAATSTLTVNSGSFAGLIQDGGSGKMLALTKNGSGTFILAGANTYTGATTVSAGTLAVSGSITSSITVQSSGTLVGTGTINGNVSGTGTFSPGSSPGTMTINGNFTPAGTVSFVVNVPYTGAGTDYDQYLVNGAVNLSGASLAFTQTTGGTPSPQQLLTLITNDLSDATTTNGSTTPTPGATVTVGSSSFRIFYNGGDGNDVVLVEASTPTTVYVDDDWTNLGDGTAIADADPVASGNQAAVAGINAFAVIQAGVSAVAAGGTVKINPHGSNSSPSGAYAENVSIARTLTLDGNGGPAGTTATTVVITPPSGSGITVTAGGNNVTIQDLRVTGTAGTGMDGLNVSSVSGFTLSNVQADNNAANGIEFSNLTGTTTLMNVVASSNASNGLVGNNLGTVNVSGGSFDSNGATGLNLSGDNGSGTTLIVSGGVNATGNSGDGLFATLFPGGSTGVSVAGGTYGSSGGDGIHFTSVGPVIFSGLVTASGTGIVDVDAAGVSQSGGSLTATALRLQGTGAFSLNQSNSIGTLAAAVVGNIQYTGADALTVATVGGTNGVSAGNVTIHAGGALTVSQPITASGGALTLSAGSGTINGSGSITANTVTLSAATGIGNTASLHLVANNLSATSSSGDINLNNNLAAPVSVTNLSTGTGNIILSQSGGGAVSVASATTTSGNITLSDTGAGLMAGTSTTGINAGSSGNVLLTTTTSGSIQLGTVAAGGNVSVNAADALSDDGSNATAVTGNLVSLMASTTIGATGTGKEIDLNAGQLTTSSSRDQYLGDSTTVLANSLSSSSGNVNLSYGTFLLNGANVIPDATAVTVNAGAALDLNGHDETIGSLADFSAGQGGTLLLSASHTLTTGGNNDTTTFSGALQGLGGLTKAGSGTFTLAGANTYTGPTVVSAGTLVLTGGSALADNDAITVASGAVLDMEQSETIGALNGSGTVRGRGTLTVTGGGIFGGTLSDGSRPLGLTVNGPSTTLVLTGANDSYTGPTTVSGGTLQVDGSLTGTGAVPVNSGGTLRGIGTITSAATVSVYSGGHLAPGDSPGILHTGALALVSGAAFDAEIGGNAPGNGSGHYSQENLSGTVDLGGATLNAASLGGYTPHAGDDFVILSNDGNDAVTSTFAGLAEGAVLSSNFLGSGLTARITYQGGDGNDVAIVVDGAVNYSGNGLRLRQSGTTPENLQVYNGATLIDSRPLASVQAGVNLVGVGSSLNAATIDYTTTTGGGPFTIAGGITFTGGTGAGSNNSLTVEGGTFASEKVTFTPADANGSNGAVNLDGQTITFTHLQPLLLQVGSVVSEEFDLSNATNHASMEASGVAAVPLQLRSTDASPTFATTQFTDPTSALTIQSFAGSTNAITVSGTSPPVAFDAAFTIAGNADTDTVSINGALTLGHNGGNTAAVSITAHVLTVNNAIDTTAGTVANVTLTSASPLTLAGGIRTPSTAIVDVNAAGVSEGSGSIISTDQLLLTGTGTFTLTNANGVNTLAAAVVGTLSYTDTDALSVGTVGGTNGIVAAAVSLVTGGPLTIDQSITVSGGTASLSANPGTVNGSGLLKANIATLSATAGIGNTAPLHLAVSSLGATSSSGDINLNNNLAAPVSVTNLSTGTGTISLSQLGGGAVSVATATTIRGNITLNDAGANLTVGTSATGINAGGSGNVLLTTTISGSIQLGTVAAGGNISVNAADAIRDDGSNATAVTGNLVSLSASTTIGAAGTGNEVDLNTGQLTTSSSGNQYLGDSTTVFINSLSSSNGAVNLSYGTFLLNGANVIPDATAVTVNAGATLDLNGHDETIGSLADYTAAQGGTILLSANHTLTMGDNNGTTTFSGVLQGMGSLTKTGSGVFTLAGANTYTGPTVVSAGTLALTGGSALADTDNVTVAPGAILDVQQSETIGALNGSGTVRGGGTLTVTGGGVFSGTLSDSSGQLDLAGTGTSTTLTLTGMSSGYTGSTTLSGGALQVDGSLTGTVGVLVASGGTLRGTGTINSAATVVVHNGGQLAPGDSPGVLNTGSLSFVSGAAFDVEIGGSTPGNGSGHYNQDNVSGTVDLGGATLNLSSFGGHTPQAGDEYLIINNDGSDAVTGKFAGLAEGAVVSSNLLGSGLTARITYQGGDGNDVAIFVEGEVSYSGTGLRLRQSGTTPEYLQVYNGGTLIDSRPLAAVQGGVALIGISGTTNTAIIDYTTTTGGGLFTIAGDITFTGGTGAGSTNTLTVVGGTFTSEKVTDLPADANGSNGAVNLDGQGISFNHLHSLLLAVGSTSTEEFDLPSSTNHVSFEASGVAAAPLQLRSTDSTPTLATTQFTDPTRALTLQSFAGTSNTIVVSGASPPVAFDAALTIAGNSNTDTVNVNGALALGHSGGNTGNAIVTANGININSTIDTSAGTTGNVMLMASGSVTLSGSIRTPATGTVDVNAAGVTQSAGTLASNGLRLQGSGTFSLGDSNAVSTLAAVTNGAIVFNDGSSALTVGTVNGTSGVNTGGHNLTLTTLGSLTIGSGAGQGITATGAVVDLNGAGTSEGTGSVLSAGSLRLQGTGTFSLANSNNIGSLAAATQGTIVLNDGSTALFVGTVNGTPGITTGNGDATLCTSSTSGIVLNQAVNVGTGTVRLQAGGPVTQAAAVRAAGLGVAAAGAVSLNNPSNNISSTFAAGDTVVNTAITFTDGVGFSTGTVASGSCFPGAVTGVSTASGGNIGLTAATGTLTVSGGITAGGTGTITLTTNATNGDIVLTGTVSSGLGNVTAQSGENITLSGGSVTSGGNVSLISNNTAGIVSQTTAAISVSAPGGNLGIIAGGGAGIASQPLGVNVNTLTVDSHAGGGPHYLADSGTAHLVVANALNAGTGTLTLTGGTFQIATSAGGNALADTSAVAVLSPAILDLNGNSETVLALAGSGGVTLGSGTLTSGNNNTSSAFSGTIGGAGGLTKVGSDTFTLAGVNSYTGATSVNGGTMTVAAGGVLYSGAVGGGAVNLNVPGVVLNGSGTIRGQVVVGASNNNVPANNTHVDGVTILVPPGGTGITIPSASTFVQIGVGAGVTIGGGNSTSTGILVQGSTRIFNSVIDGHHIGINVNGGAAAVQNTDLSNDTAGSGSDSATGLLVRNGAIVDAGQLNSAAGYYANITGLGVSTGGNTFYGYTLDTTGSAGLTGVSQAIRDLNSGMAPFAAAGVEQSNNYSAAGPQLGRLDVTAQGNTFGSTAGPATQLVQIEQLVYHDLDNNALGFVSYGTATALAPQIISPVSTYAYNPTLLASTANNGAGSLINGPQGTEQQSAIRYLQITFSSYVFLDPNLPSTGSSQGLNLVKINGPYGAGQNTTIHVNVASTVYDQGSGHYTVIYSLSGPGTEYASLEDGNYRLQFIAAAIQGGGPGGPGLAASSFVDPASYVALFHRFFGDSLGRSLADDTDLAAFQAAYRSRIGQPAYRAALDFNLDGFIDSIDYYQFLRRYRTRLMGNGSVSPLS